MKTYTLVIKMQVSDNWVNDGFNPLTENTQRGIIDALRDNLLDYANYGIEFKVNLISVNAKPSLLKGNDIQ